MLNYAKSVLLGSSVSNIARIKDCAHHRSIVTTRRRVCIAARVRHRSHVITSQNQFCLVTRASRCSNTITPKGWFRTAARVYHMSSNITPKRRCRIIARLSHGPIRSRISFVECCRPEEASFRLMIGAFSAHLLVKLPTGFSVV